MEADSGLVEFIPNFSEGRNQETIDEIVRAGRESPRNKMVDVSWNHDHNRLVVTCLSPPDAAKEAIMKMARVAVARIDLRVHEGRHPRMGALDAVPIVPARGIDFQDCVDLSRDIGQALAEEFDIPVYLYAGSASGEDRRRLASVRGAGFEWLQDAITQPGREPDFGPMRVHPSAGATALGARLPAIAYNVDLASTDLSLAEGIARKVREASGGLANIQALGLRLDQRGCVQVSMNVHDCETTGLHRVFEIIRAEAESHGVAVLSSEVVGLLPLDVLVQTCRHYLRLHELRPSQVLETWFE